MANPLGNIPVFRYGLKRGTTDGITPFAVRYEPIRCAATRRRK
jgi:hypothetical protein